MNKYMNILQEIFADYYEEILLTLHPCATEIENIDRMINFGDPSYGGTMYACTKCGHMKFVPFRCHSRFCPTCGNLYAKNVLMQHIPEKHFKMIRYYGIYARHRKIDENLRRQRTLKQRRLFASFTRWQEAILIAFVHDPIQCPNCKTTMEILEIYHNHHRVSLQELCERVHIRYMAKHWRSSA